MKWIVTNGERFVRGQKREAGYMSFDTTADRDEAFRFKSKNRATAHADVLPKEWKVEQDR